MFKPSSHPFMTDLGLLVLRLVVGFTFFFHGTQKLFGWFDGPGLDKAAEQFGSFGLPVPSLSVVLAALAETLGGLALISGLFARWLAIALAFTMLVAAFVVHGHAFSLQNTGMEYTLVLASCATLIALAGPGRFAFGLKKCKKKEG